MVKRVYFPGPVGSRPGTVNGCFGCTPVVFNSFNTLIPDLTSGMNLIFLFLVSYKYSLRLAGGVHYSGRELASPDSYFLNFRRICLSLRLSVA